MFSSTLSVLKTINENLDSLYDSKNPDKGLITAATVLTVVLGTSAAIVSLGWLVSKQKNKKPIYEEVAPFPRQKIKKITVESNMITTSVKNPSEIKAERENASACFEARLLPTKFGSKIPKGRLPKSTAGHPNSAAKVKKLEVAAELRRIRRG